MPALLLAQTQTFLSLAGQAVIVQLVLRNLHENAVEHMPGSGHVANFANQICIIILLFQLDMSSQLFCMARLRC